MAEDAADKAIAALNGTMVGGRALNINEARLKAVSRRERIAGWLSWRPERHTPLVI